MDKRLTKKLILTQEGFTLMEVLVAVALFGVFVTAFSVSQVGNVNSSINMQQSMTLLNLCESKINEAIINPPKFTNLTDKEVITKNFTEEGYKQYKYSISYKKIEFPDFAGLLGQTEEESNTGNDALVKKTIFKKMKDNIEKMLWQVHVKVENTQNNEYYELSSWITNEKAQVDTNFGL